VNDIAIAIRAGDWSSVAFLLVHGGSFSSGFNRISTNVSDVDGICSEFFDVGDDGVNVAEAGDFLE